MPRTSEKLWKKVLKKKIRKKSFGSDTYTETGPWFQFLIPKPGFGCTLAQIYMEIRFFLVKV